MHLNMKRSKRMDGQVGSSYTELSSKGAYDLILMQWNATEVFKWNNMT